MTKYEISKIILAVVLIIGSIFCFYNQSQNGRFVFSNSTGIVTPLVIDTQTGTIYILYSKQKLEIENFKMKLSK